MLKLQRWWKIRWRVYQQISLYFIHGLCTMKISSRSLGDPVIFLRLTSPKRPRAMGRIGQRSQLRWSQMSGRVPELGIEFPNQMMVWYSLLMFVLIGPGGCINAYWVYWDGGFFCEPVLGPGVFFCFFFVVFGIGFTALTCSHSRFQMFRAKCGWICSVNMIKHVPNCCVDKSSPHFGI